MTNVEIILNSWIKRLEEIDKEIMKKFTFNWNCVSGLFKQVQFLLTDYLEKNETEENNILEQKEEALNSSYSDNKEKNILLGKNLDSSNKLNLTTQIETIKRFDSKNLQKIEEEKDNILNELKLIKFEGSEKKDMSLEEVNREMMKLINESVKIPQNNEKQTNTKFSRQTANSNVIPDYAYPFKQDKFSCNIL